MELTRLKDEWTRIQAPRTGELRADLLQDAAEFLGLALPDAADRLSLGATRFKDEWTRVVGQDHSQANLARFYNFSDAELFELINWHASDPIHYRTLILRDLARQRPGRAYLDYGSGIGSDALVLAEAGFEVTLADISDLLLRFAAFRCRKRGFPVQTIDLRRDGIPSETFDLVVCFDVLEHVPEPLPIVRNLRRAMRRHGLLAMHAPFGEDPDHPMHVAHLDVVTPRMRSLGFLPQECYFPNEVRAPQVYRKEAVSAIDRAGYYMYDSYLNNRVGARLASWYRRLRRSRTAPLVRA